MTPESDEEPLVCALVHLHVTSRGALEVHVRGVEPPQDLGRVPLDELPVLLEALAAGASAGTSS